MITEGGFPAGSMSQLGIRQFTVPGTNVDFPAGMAPFAAPLLLWVAGQIHHRVEKLHDGWCWGYSFRNVRGGFRLSDHSGGVAIDINAPAHPRGVRGTWSASQVAEIRKILAEANSHGTVIAWGHDFRTTVDDMHFAARGTKTAVIAAGARLNAPREWDEVATKAEIRDVMDNAIEAALPSIVHAVVVEISGKLAEDDSPLSNRFRRQVRTAVQAELDERK